MRRRNWSVLVFTLLKFEANSKEGTQNKIICLFDNAFELSSFAPSLERKSIGNSIVPPQRHRKYSINTKSKENSKKSWVCATFQNRLFQLQLHFLTFKLCGDTTNRTVDKSLNRNQKYRLESNLKVIFIISSTICESETAPAANLNEPISKRAKFYKKNSICFFLC